MRFALQNSQVQGQQGENEEREAAPKQDVDIDIHRDEVRSGPA
jgi:hypothetical protein